MTDRVGHERDEARRASWLYRSLWALALALFALDWVLHRHEELEWASMLGFYALYGLFASLLLTVIAQGLRRMVKRPEDYYER